MDEVLKDLDTVFFNTDEFATEHNINGQQVLCIVDTDTNKTRSDRESEQYDGIFLSVVKVSVKVSLLPKKPAHGKLFKLDDKPYTVIECSDNAGMYDITLGLNNS